ncbi:MAG TPA: preprotein translocase subunit SecG [Pirellulaceae bacterium]|nr:preprotein translocase subunit SecG [Pirellulaceae bacterium]
MEIWLTLFGLVVIAVSIFLILLILVQRGRGGGLTGALGGMGGQSAFGSKAGDVFTRITIVAATIWILLSTLMIALFNRPVREVDDAPRSAAIGSVEAEDTGDTEAPGELGESQNETEGQSDVDANDGAKDPTGDAPPTSTGDAEQAGDQEKTDQEGGDSAEGGGDGE